MSVESIKVGARGTSVTLFGYLSDLHGPDGSCTDCHGRTPATVTTIPTGAITPEEWAVFTAALAAVVDGSGEVHQSAVRPLIRGRIEPKHVGQCYRRAKRLGLLTWVRKEPSSDTAGRNTHHDSPVYAYRSAAA